MIGHRVYSLRKLLAFGVIFTLLGVASATSVSFFVNQITQPSESSYSPVGISTNQEKYYPDERMYIYVINLSNQTMTFKDDTYGLFFEKWTGGQWSFLFSIGNSSRTSELDSIWNDDGNYKGMVVYELGEEFSDGRYRVGSIGYITYGEGTIAVKGFSEFDIITVPPPTGLLLLKITLDKAVYHSGDVVNVTIKNEGNRTLTFGDSSYSVVFEKWSGISWEFYEGVPGVEVLTYLEPGEIAHVVWELGGQADRPFPAGKYRAVSQGWYEEGSNQHVIVWGYAEFSVK